MVLDNGRFHHAKSLVIPDNVMLIFLPPYSPELNPIERLWQDIKQKLFARTYQTLEQMQQQLSQILGSIQRQLLQKSLHSHICSTLLMQYNLAEWYYICFPDEKGTERQSDGSVG